VLCVFDIVTKRMESRATAKAQRKLDAALRMPDMIACPECGRFQQDMVRCLKSRGLRKAFALSGLVAFAGIVFGGPCVGLLNPTLIALSLASALLAWVFLYPLYVMRNPNSCHEFERHARAAASEAVPIAEHQKRQEKLADAQSAFDWMDPGDLRQQQEFADDQRRRGQRREHLRRRLAILSLAAVTIGAVFGALLDAALFGVPKNMADRIGLALIIAPMGGLLVWFLMTVGQAIFSQVDADDGWKPPPRSGPPIDGATVNARAALVITALLTAFFAAGMGQGTVHGYAMVVGGEALLLFLLQIVFPQDHNT
jgi:hypothetical protein